MIDFHTRRPFDIEGSAVSATLKAVVVDFDGVVRPHVSGHATGRIDTAIGEMGLPVGGGHQAEDIAQDMVRIDAFAPQVTAAGDTVDAPVNVTKRYLRGTKALTHRQPSINLRAELDRNLYLQLSYSRQMSRPAFNVLAPTTSLDFVNGYAAGIAGCLSPGAANTRRRGFVHSRPRTGTIVQRRRQSYLLDPGVSSWTFLGTPDLMVVRGLFELRAMVEPLGAALAAERRTRADINAMREGMSAMSQHGLHHIAGQAGDRAFHDAILNATGNEYVMVLTSSIGAAVMMTTRFKQRSRALPRDPIPGHRRVFDAIVAEDRSGAAPAMQMLVDQALEDTRQAMDLTTT